MSDNPHRLPRAVIPRHYTIRLEPDLEAFTFAGSVVIDLEVIERADSITLNALDLEIGSCVIRSGTDTIAVTAVETDEAMQRATLRLETPAPLGPATLDIGFTGTLNDQLHGFYRSTFTDVAGETQVIATTQFEATDARRAFPCFDEPDLKATFGVTLVVPSEVLAVSNGAEVSSEPAGEGRVAVTFADTMRMSTYLVAFVVGPLVPTAPVVVDGVPLRVITPKGKEHLTRFALECGEFCLRYLADYYDIPYPGDKVDLVAIPDFAFGAMENLGCITFRETALLVDPETATQAELVRILDVVAHELAHMWFGDLVTMEWWDGIWLNEAFATFMEMKATDAMRPDWKRWVSFGAAERPWAFSVDALASTRPVEFEVTSPDEANEMFDALTYGKGSSVLRMIEQYLGELTFQAGVGDYLRKHSYANTVTADLWEGLNRASSTDVGAVMDTWILQGGFPQVEVAATSQGIRLTQRRFLAMPDETDQTTWKIPVQVRGSAGGIPIETKVLLADTEQVVPIEGEIDWIVANGGGHGFYRVSYQPALATRMVDALPHLDDLERFVLIDDAWAFVESGQTGVGPYLDLAKAYRDETEHAVWTALVGGLSAVRHHITKDEDLARFGRLVADLVAPGFARLGWEPGTDDPDLTRRLRGLLLGALGRVADDPEVVERSGDIAARWLESPAGLDPDVAQAALFTWATHGGLDEQQRLLDAYRGAATPQAEMKLLQALAMVDGSDAVDATLAAILDGTVRSQDGAWVVARMLGGRSSGAHTWQRLRSDWSGLTAKMPPMTMRRLVEGLPALSQPAVSAEVHAFFAETDLPAIAKTVAQNLEKLRTNTNLRTAQADLLSEYLEG